MKEPVIRKTNVSILLSTFNGAKYLAEQIDSILAQTFSNWTLYIRDDCSTDSTIDIIKEYCEMYGNIFLIDSRINLGPLKSFLYLMDNVESEYYMFCDQDDVWLPNKVEVSLNILIGLENCYGKRKSLLVYSDLIVVDDELNVIYESMWNATKLKYIMDPLEYLYVTPLATGCTMLFNNVAKLDALKFSKSALMHDSLVAMSVLASDGKIGVIDSALVFYRQHSANVFGTSAFNSSFLWRVFHFRKSISTTLKYYLFVNELVGITTLRFLFLKLKASLKIRNLI